jgi:hypothetical protein
MKKLLIETDALILSALKDCLFLEISAAIAKLFKFSKNLILVEQNKKNFYNSHLTCFKIKRPF